MYMYTYMYIIHVDCSLYTLQMESQRLLEDNSASVYLKRVSYILAIRVIHRVCQGHGPLSDHTVCTYI